MNTLCYSSVGAFSLLLKEGWENESWELVTTTSLDKIFIL